MTRILCNYLIICILIPAPLYASPREVNADYALQELNDSFIKAHAAARKQDLTTGPIIIHRDGQLTLINKNTRVTADVILPAYHVFKTFAHIPVAIYLILAPQGDGMLNFERFQLLRNYYKKMQYVEKNFYQIPLNSTDLERQKLILSDSMLFVKTLIENQRFTKSKLFLFTRGMLPLIRANIKGAAKNQLDTMHLHIMKWKSKMTPELWSKLRVVTQGAVLAREGDLAKQYFKRLLQIKKEGMKLAYKEMYFQPTPMLTLLATRSVDRGISIAIFNNPDRMFRDVLSEAAESYIKTMKFE